MIHRIVQFALRQRFLVLMVTRADHRRGRRFPSSACRSTPIPDLSPPMVELITQWPGHAAEEVERLTTLPLELAMNGTPNLQVMRSISLYGLSDVILTFDEGTDAYFARQVVFQRISDASLPTGVTPSMAPLFSPSGLVYRYVIESPDRTPHGAAHLRRLDHRARLSQRSRRRRRFRFRRHHDAVSSAARPRELYNFHLPVVQVVNALTANNANTGGGFYSQGGQFYYVRGLGLAENDGRYRRSRRRAATTARPCASKTSAMSRSATRRGWAFSAFRTKENNDDAVEGVILMRRGEQTQNVLQGRREENRRDSTATFCRPT